MSKYIVYTDGGCLKNPGGAGACAAVILSENKRVVKKITESYHSTTNNRMEILAIILALESLNAGDEVTVYSDSQYVIKTMLKEFKKSKNLDLWERLDKAMMGKKIRPKWVKGHNGDKYNEMCDEMCKNGMKKPTLHDTGYENAQNTAISVSQLKLRL